MDDETDDDSRTLSTPREGVSRNWVLPLLTESSIGAVLAPFRGPGEVRQEPERPAPPRLRRLNQLIGADDNAGLWHEIHIVERANYEAAYSNMSLFGLVKAIKHVPAVRPSGDHTPSSEAR